MQPFGIRWPFVGKHGGLPETAEAVAAEIMRQIAEKPAERLGEARLFAAGPQRLQHADRLLMQIFRQVGDGRADLIMNGVAFFIRRPAHGHQFQREPGLFEPQKFLGDESLGQARIALEEHHDFFCICHVARVSFEAVIVREPVTRSA